MNPLKHLVLLALVLTTQFACSMNNLPRNMSLKAFDPHRASFTCKHEAAAVPPIDAEAEAWLQEGLRLTSRTLWPNQRDYAKAAQLWQQAADRKHWKAMLNLASLYAHGEGVPKDTERAVQIVEAAMKLGIPGAYDVMGTYHMEGRGVNQDASRAYAFWQLAADMGSPSAQAYLGEKISGTYDDPKAGFWGNRKVALQMLECGFAQGNGKAAYELGALLTGTVSRDYARALRVLHEGVKFGSAESANSLFANFDDGNPMVGRIKDPARAERYNVLADALRRDPDLRLPNLDKVLPLPPAPLPKWNGERQTLIDAAKPLAPLPLVRPTPGSSRTGRAYIPPGHVLPEELGQAPQPDEYGRAVPFQYETTRAQASGYWYPSVGQQTEDQRAFAAQAQPLRYDKGEFFDDLREGRLSPADGRILWDYRGQPIKLAEPAGHPKEAQGLARYTRIPQPGRYCNGASACPATGVWFGRADDDHPLAAVFNRLDRQAYLGKGQSFPDPAQLHLAIAPQQVTWLYLGHANELNASGLAEVSVEQVVPQKVIEA